MSFTQSPLTRSPAFIPEAHLGLLLGVGVADKVAVGDKVHAVAGAANLLVHLEAATHAGFRKK